MKIAELREIPDFRAESDPGSSQLVISGLVIHSALAVGRVSTFRESDRMVVEVHLVVTRPGLSGSFVHCFTVPKGVDRVVFGLERKEIWKRH